MSRDASRARPRKNINLATIVRRLGLYNKLFKGAGDHENKEQEEISRLEIEVEKLKDLCLKQREEIKSLQSTILFPDSSMSSQLISSLQRQLASLEGRLQALARDVAELKAEKSFGRGLFDNRISSPMTTLYDRDYGAKPRFDLEYSSSHYTTPSSSHYTTLSPDK